MNYNNSSEPGFKQILEDFRYDLIKAVIFIIIFTATIIYSYAESSKYYPHTQNYPVFLNK
jgi:hypothetical protein